MAVASYILPKTFKEAIASTWADKDIASTKSAAELVYKFLRNTMIHGYRAQAVYITGETKDLGLGENYLVLNPYWFWNAFKKPYEEFFVELSKAQANNSVKQCCDAYLAKLLN